MDLCCFNDNGMCVACGAPRINVRQVCGTWQPGLGDRLAAGLDAVGITKGRVASVVGDCGCDQRQEALNQLGYRLGIGTPPNEPSA